MPKRTDLRTIFIIGSGPIVIGQACEFDYSGTQACKALREEGYEVVLLNSNPATIMTDPETADRTYVEPITVDTVEQIVARERPQAILPTLGGQTALNVAFAAADAGIFDRYGVEMIGADRETIRRAEDRDAYKKCMIEAGLDLPESGLAYSLEQARQVARRIGLPAIVRPAYTLGGIGGGVAYNLEEFDRIAAAGLQASMIGEILVEESCLGWKEFELEVMRDRLDNVVIVCSIENVDPMGVHTGDSITVAPVQTLTDREYQAMRDAAIRIIRAVGVETGGCNIQFAVHPETGRMVAIEMNPRVSRSSALASKATGFPIAKIAAKVAVGYTLDEIPNDITRETPSCFEPTIDYCVVKVPRFTFEKFPQADPTLTTSMKSVGEAMAIGRTFKEALQKGLRSLEIRRMGLGCDGRDPLSETLTRDVIEQKLSVPNAQRVFYLRYAFQQGMTVDEVHELTRIDPWFLDNIAQIVETEDLLRWRPLTGPDALSDDELRGAKQMGFSDVQLGQLTGTDEHQVRERREQTGIEPVYKLVDTCAAEFEAYTPYYYSTYEEEDETRRGSKPCVMILGGGPNRIGQGIEFDYCCVHASMALRDMGYESVMVNGNPETVSTDYDISDRLYFEPLTLEDVLSIVQREQPLGLIVQFGGQTPLNLAVPLHNAGVPILGTAPDSIDRAEDRARFAALCRKVDIRQTENGMAHTWDEARKIAARLGYPVIVRPSFVLGGRAMEIVYDEAELRHFVREALAVSEGQAILVDKFLQNAVEIDVDAVADGRDVFIAGIMEHIEQAGVHSGDAAMVLPPQDLAPGVQAEIRRVTRELALELPVKGLMNIQFAAHDGRTLYVLEVNPRGSRTVPFVSKVVGIPVAKVATRVMLGQSLRDQGLGEHPPPYAHVGVKESVFPFSRFWGVDAVLGPEMKSTGEVLGIDRSFGLAFAKSQLAAGTVLPTSGSVFLSVRDEDKPHMVDVARRLHDMGFNILATDGTSRLLHAHGIPSQRLHKVSQGRPNIVDYIKNRSVDLIINTPSGNHPHADEVRIRSSAVAYDVPLVTTATGARAAVTGIVALRSHDLCVACLQEYTGKQDSRSD